MSPTHEALPYLALPLIGLEVALMVYVYRLRPEASGNRLYALFMLTLALAAAFGLISSTAESYQLAIAAAWLQALATLMSGPLLWLVLLVTFFSPRWHPPWVRLLLVTEALLPVLLLLIDALLPAELMVSFSPVQYNGGYISLQHLLSTPLGFFFFRVNVLYLNFAVIIPFALMALSKRWPSDLRRAARILLLAVLFVGALNPLLNAASPVLQALFGPMTIAVSTGWIISRYGILSPIATALRRAIDSAAVGLLIFDAQDHLLEANAAGYRLLSSAPDQPLPPTLPLFLSWLDQQVESAPQWPSTEGRQSPFQVELILPATHAVGQRYLDLNLESITGNVGQPMGTFVTMVELTAERKAQHKLREANLEISRRARELETLAALSAALRQAETVSDIGTLVLAHTLAAVSARSGALFLADEAGELALRQRFPSGISPARINAARAGQADVVARVAAGAPPQVTANIAEDPLLALWAASHGPVGCSITLPLSAQSNILGVLTLALDADLTSAAAYLPLLLAAADIAANALRRAQVLQTLEQKVAERTHALTEANIQLQELDSLKSKFIADISHELRTPLASINLYLDLLKRGSPERNSEYQEVLQAKVLQLNRLVEQILEMTRLDELREELDARQISLNRLVEQVVIAFQPDAETSAVCLEYYPARDLPPVYGSAEHLHKMVSHLIDNALRHTPSGTVRVATSHDAGRRAVKLEVTDAGPGIAPDDLPHLFDRFYRGDRVSQSTIPGTGLGLALLKEIVEIHGGEVAAENAQPAGATFTVWLPAAGQTTSPEHNHQN